MTSARGRCADCRYLRRIDSRDGRRRRCQYVNVEQTRLYGPYRIAEAKRLGEQQAGAHDRD